jgi:hypothetical protein
MACSAARIHCQWPEKIAYTRRAPLMLSGELLSSISRHKSAGFLEVKSRLNKKDCLFSTGFGLGRLGPKCKSIICSLNQRRRINARQCRRPSPGDAQDAGARSCLPVAPLFVAGGTRRSYGDIHLWAENPICMRMVALRDLVIHLSMIAYSVSEHGCQRPLVEGWMKE